MKTFETDAIVLSTRDHGESDRLVAFHSAGFGTLRGIAKGARRSRKRFANVFEPCSLVRLECREKNSYIWIEACELVEPYLPMRTDIEKWAYAALFSEIILEMVPAGEPHPGPFLLHKKTLDRLECDKDPQNVLLLALLRFPVFDGVYAGHGWMRGLQVQAENFQTMVLAGGSGKTGLRGSLLFEYQVYYPGYGDVGVNTIFEDNANREDLAASDAPGDESASFEGPSRLVRLSYRETNPEH